MSFFHAGKMTTHHVKILRFHCSYFRLVCVYVCVCACVYVCAATRHSRVKISCFHCSYFQHMCVCAAAGHVKIPHFRCSYFWLAFVFVWTQAGWLQGAGLNSLRAFPNLNCAATRDIVLPQLNFCIHICENLGMPYKVMAHYHKSKHFLSKLAV